MKFFMAMAIGWACSKIFLRHNSVPRLTAPPAKKSDVEDKEFTTEIRDEPPAQFLTKFEYFPLLSENGIEKYESREFVACNYKWRLVIYPDGIEKDNHISAYLELITSLPAMDSDIKAIFNIFLFNHKLDNYLCFRGNVRRFTKTKPKWGFNKLISGTILRDPSNGYIFDNDCVFGAEVFIVGSQPVIESLSPIKPPAPPLHIPKSVINCDYDLGFVLLATINMASSMLNCLVASYLIGYYGTMTTQRLRN